MENSNPRKPTETNTNATKNPTKEKPKESSDPPIQDSVQEESLEIKLGPRSQRLVALMDKALEATLKTFRLEKINITFPTIYKENPKVLKDTYDQAAKLWRRNVEEKFKGVLEQENVIKKLNELDLIIQRQTQNKSNDVKAQPSIQDLIDLKPSQILRARKLKLLQERYHQIQTKRKKVEEETQSLTNNLTNLKNQLTNQLESLKKSKPKQNLPTVPPINFLEVSKGITNWKRKDNPLQKILEAEFNSDLRKRSNVQMNEEGSKQIEEKEVGKEDLNQKETNENLQTPTKRVKL